MCKTDVFKRASQYITHCPVSFAYDGRFLNRIVDSILIRLIENNLFPTNAAGEFILDEKNTFKESYLALERIYKAGKAKAIGVSNFSVKTCVRHSSPLHVSLIPFFSLEELAQVATIVPAVNQVEYVFSACTRSAT